MFVVFMAFETTTSCLCFRFVWELFFLSFFRGRTFQKGWRLHWCPMTSASLFDPILRQARDSIKPCRWHRTCAPSHTSVERLRAVWGWMSISALMSIAESSWLCRGLGMCFRRACCILFRKCLLLCFRLVLWNTWKVNLSLHALFSSSPSFPLFPPSFSFSSFLFLLSLFLFSWGVTSLGVNQGDVGG